MIFDIDYSAVLWNLLTPPDKRQAKQLAWGSAIMAGKQWKGDTFFDGYMQGAVYLTPPVTPAANAYNPAATYITGDRVIYAIQAGGAYFGDNAVYEAISINADGSNNAGFAGIAPIGGYIVPQNPPASALVNGASALAWLSGYYWIPVQPNFIGANERASYSCNKIIFEYALNKWFGGTFRQPSAGVSDIYLVTNTDTNNQLYIYSSVVGDAIFSTPRQDTQFEFSQTPSATVVDFNMYFPVAMYNALVDTSVEAAVGAGYIAKPSTYTLRNARVRSFADTINCAGMVYNIITY